MRRSALLAMVVASAAAVEVGTPTAAYAQARPVVFDADLGNLESAVDRLTRQYAHASADLKQYELRRRLVDGGILFELGQHEAAAILLLDVVEDPAFASNPERPAATLTLGKALLKLRNYQAAREFLQRVAYGASSAMADEARFHLVEIALQFDDAAALLELTTGLSNATTDRTRYAVGKALVRLKQYERAVTTLEGVTGASRLHPLARYYAAVSHTALEAYDRALSIFQQLASRPPTGPEETEARDLALLGVGRLLMEKGELDNAIETYRKVQRTSPHFEVALYEMAWSYLKKEQYADALTRVDLLLLLVKDERLDVEANVLRGQVSTLMNDYGQATRSYDQIVNRFAPIRNELNMFLRDPDNLERYFSWLIERRSHGGQLMAPLSERTAAWVESTDQMGRLVEVFDWLGEEKQEIEETREIADELSRIVSGSNRVELFPKLKAGWTRALALQNQLLLLTSRMLDAQYGQLRGGLGRPGQIELDTLVQVRRKLEGKVRKQPMTYAQFESRHNYVTQRYLDLRRQSFLVGQQLEDVKEQLLAVEGFLDEEQYGSDPANQRPADEVAALREEVIAEKGRLTSLFDEMKGLSASIKIAAENIGVGDALSREEENARAELMQIYKREGGFYDERTAGLAKPQRRDFQGFTSHRDRVWTSVGKLDGVVRALDGRVADKAAQLMKVISDETFKILGYENEIGAYVDNGRDVSRSTGRKLFERAGEEMNEVVLEADLGLVDVAWFEKVQRTEKLKALNKDRSKRLQRLEEEYRPLIEDPDLDVSEPAAPVGDKAAPGGDAGGKSDGETAPKAPSKAAAPTPAEAPPAAPASSAPAAGDKAVTP